MTAFLPARTLPGRAGAGRAGHSRLTENACRHTLPRYPHLISSRRSRRYGQVSLSARAERRARRLLMSVPAQRPDDGAGASMTGAQILLSGTDPGTAQLSSDLSALGYRICVVGGRGQPTIDSPDLRPALALIDLEHHGPDGIEIASCIRHRHPIPVIYLTGSVGVSRLLQLGDRAQAAGYLVKPYSKRQLLLTVTTVLREAANQRRETLIANGVLHSINDGLIVTDEAGEIIISNDAVRHILGKPIGEASLARRAEEYGIYYPDRVTRIPTDDLPTAHVIRGEKVDSFEIYVRNESQPEGRYVAVSGGPLYDHAGRISGGVVVLRDVTRLKATERSLLETGAKLQEQNRTMEAVFNSISDGVVVADENLRFVMFNPSAERTIGIGAVDGEPSDWSDLYGIFYMDKVTRVPFEDLPLTRAARGISTDQQELFIRNQYNKDGCFISVSGRPIRDQDGNSGGGVAVFRDVTEQIEADQALAQAFVQGRLEVIDTTLHNIGNAINSVSIGIGTLREELGENEVLRRLQALAVAVKAHRDDWLSYLQNDPQGRRVLPFILAIAADFQAQSERLAKSVERISGRVAHIVDIIRTQRSFDDGAMVNKNIVLQKALDDAVKVLSDSLKAREIELRIDCEAAPVELYTHESKFHQMMVNLIKNSMEAIDELARTAPGAARSIDIHCYRKDGFLVIEVIDSGVGIEGAHQRRIFSAGFSTKADGSGLGLHSAANFVIGSGGSISARSAGTGKGTTMRVMLRNPVREKDPDA